MSVRSRKSLWVLLLPGLLVTVLIYVIPTLLIVLYSFLERKTGGGVLWQATLAAYQKLFAYDPSAFLLNNFVVIILRSLWWSLLCTLISLLVGYPLAFLIAQRSPVTRSVLLFLVMIPFWTNFLVRIYAIKFILNNNGLLNTLLTAWHLPNLALINTPAAVMIGLVYGTLPFMILPLYASIVRFDYGLVEAAQDLGAGDWSVFWRIFLPLTLPGVVAGSVLSFILSLGQYIVPVILGGGKVMMIGNLLENQFREGSHWPFGSAIAVFFVLLLMVGLMSYLRRTEGARL